MDRRSQSSLTHRIVSEILGLVLVAGVLVIATVPDLNANRLGQGLAVYAVIFTFVVLVWWQLGGMAAVGMLRNTLNNFLGMLSAFAIVLLPIFLRLAMADTGDLQKTAMRAVPLALALVGVALALMIRTSNVYQSKRQWRLVHHSIWAASLLFLATAFLPSGKLVLGFVPVPAVAWFLILAIPLIARRMGVSLVATPAQPPSPRSYPTENTHAHANDAARNPQSSNSSNDSPREENAERRPQRGRGGHYRHRRQGGSRRRV